MVVSGSFLQNDGDTYNVALFRFTNGENKTQIIATKIKRWLQHQGISWQRDGNVLYYTVQRSTDGGVTYQPVAKFYNNKLFYNYEDVATQTANSNTGYRVAITAKGGERLFSNTVFIDETSNARVYPNPVRGNMQLQGLPADSKTKIAILDLNGNVRTTATASGGTASITTSNLAPGNYLLKLQHNNTITTQTFVKE